MEPAAPSPAAKKIRTGVAILVLAGLVASLFLMLPPYLDNFQFQRGIQAVLDQPGVSTQTEDGIRTAVTKTAAARGMSVSPSQIRVEKVAGRVRVEVIYTVRVEFPLYSVDLHFRPSATSR